MKRKYIYSGIVVVVLVLSTVVLFLTTGQRKTVANESSDKNFVLKIAENNDLCGAPQQLAIAKGYFKAEGLKIKVVKLGSDTTNFEGVNSGKIDASNSMMGSLVQPLANGAKIKITTGLHTGCLQILVKKGSNIKSAKDLIGKKVGVGDIAGSAATYVRRYLGHYGVDVSAQHSQVQLAAYSASELPIVLQKGQVDAIALGDPDTEIDKAKYNLVTLSASATDPAFKDEYCCVAYVSDDIAKNHPAVAAKYTLALQKGAKWAEEHPEETVAIQTSQHYIDGDKKLNIKMLKSYQFKPSYSGAKKAFTQVGGDLQKLKVVDKNVDLKALQQASFFKTTASN
ncbi:MULTISPECIES: ABC transporter substrate-binding protein [Leuconostoc]|uniref:ABC transporter substrate-binding protein n=2 Tax=Leuconostoc kimchii TaxID=136609 RepID=A0ABX5SIY1_9LACO|nr:MULTISPECIES: ABC transporter substrate-binding protein [Leuconostoc]ADG39988.1 putative ABC transporter, substrate-binding protein [Leuconostoc kimchii IMSNU 11154]AEJ30212.1 putative ABC transporter, substrate-binding protein [Leuconostoc sp. C2]QBR47296.1 ABC transporter substrate-binding protein [Leuconostoc kimchii]